MRLGLIGQLRRVWASRGVKVVQHVEYKYQWAYLNLAVNGVTGSVKWCWTKDMKAASIAPVVKQWAAAGVQYLVWDRARGHHGDAYDGIEVERVFQPPYSRKWRRMPRPVDGDESVSRGRTRCPPSTMKS